MEKSGYISLTLAISGITMSVSLVLSIIFKFSDLSVILLFLLLLTIIAGLFREVGGPGSTK
jgi:hypothetical protein